MSRKLWSFHGGLSLPEHKQSSTSSPVEIMPLVNEYFIPLQQHIGEAAYPLVEIGQHVLKGEMIARAEGKVSVALHAPTSGTIKAITPHPIAHSSGLSAPAILLQSDGKDEAAPRKPLADYLKVDEDALRE
ncbi:MAG: electron transport complex subunit RsxC, partial [Gammaproteobacteria bacterium]|nr:electron transport complex subunit RsxC [Gammaproteobacteria bacterium]